MGGFKSSSAAGGSCLIPGAMVDLNLLLSEPLGKVQVYRLALALAMPATETLYRRKVFKPLAAAVCGCHSLVVNRTLDSSGKREGGGIRDGKDRAL